jgi:peptidoglycan hydrolase CwlO-like protein
MSNLDDYNDLLKKVTAAKERAIRAAGAKDQLLQQLKKDFNCKTLEEGEEELRRLSKELATVQQKFETKFNEFESKWHGKI